jgi:hypothetical protein
MRARSLALFVAGLCLTPAVSLAEATGEIRGEVLRMAKETRTPAAGATVQLRIFRNGVEAAGARTVAEANGRYVFRALSTAPEYRYEAEALDGEVPFRSQSFEFGGRPTLVIPALAIVPVTGDPATLLAREAILLQVEQPNLLSVSHHIAITNGGEVTYDGRTEGGRPIEIRLPDGASRLEMGQGLSRRDTDWIEDERLLRVDLQVRGGGRTETTIEFGYSLPYEGSKLGLSLPMNLARERATVALVDPKIRIRSDTLSFDQEKEIQKRTYRFFGGGPLAANEPLRFELRGLPAPGRTGSDPFVLFAALGLVAAAAAMLALKKHRGLESTDPDEARERCFRLFDQLERDFEAGTLGAAEYREERERLREVLFDLQTSDTFRKRA